MRFFVNNVTTLSNSGNSAREARRKKLGFWIHKNAICKGKTVKNGSLLGIQKNANPANFGSGKIGNNVTTLFNWRDFGRIRTLRGGGFIINSAVLLLSLGRRWGSVFLLVSRKAQHFYIKIPPKY